MGRLFALLCLCIGLPLLSCEDTNKPKAGFSCPPEAPHLHFREYRDRKFMHRAQVGVELDIPTAAHCAQACQQRACASFSYTPHTHVCVTFQERAGDAGTQVVHVLGERYYMAYCDTHKDGGIVVTSDDHGKCSDPQLGLDLVWVTQPHTDTQLEPTRTLPTDTTVQCLQACIENLVCRSVTRNTFSGQCQLYAETISDDGPTRIDNSGTHYYEYTCGLVPTIQRCDAMQLFTWHMEHHKALFRSDKADRFLFRPDLALGYPQKCQDACADAGSACKSVQYKHRAKTCSLYSGAEGYVPADFTTEPDTDFYSGQCITRAHLPLSGCIADKLVQWTIHDNHRLESAAVFIRRGSVTLEECREMCVAHPFGCRMAAFHPHDQVCALSHHGLAGGDVIAQDHTGFSLHEWNCGDMSGECATKKPGCEQLCVDTKKGFECRCRHGYRLQANGKSCKDINECSSPTVGCAQDCVNTEGSFRCECRAGYRLRKDGKQCADVDECDKNNGGCQHKCSNIEGGHQCVCEAGYRLGEDGRSCHHARAHPQQGAGTTGDGHDGGYSWSDVIIILASVVILLYILYRSGSRLLGDLLESRGGWAGLFKQPKYKA